MKLALNEIWEFLQIAPEPSGNHVGAQWRYILVAGDIKIPKLKTNDVVQLKNPKWYDTELLPSIFTFREVLWQPNVYTSPALCIPQLNILKVFCEEFEDEFSKVIEAEGSWPFFELLRGLARFCQEAIDSLQVTDFNAKEKIARVLGEFRRKAFPVMQFFIFHPSNRQDYQKDAVNRLNYAVKIMITQYHNKFFELEDCYWDIKMVKRTQKVEVQPDQSQIIQHTKQNQTSER